ncbi:MAG: DPP IV N-terminal domain-containing protein, partial [Acidimicrobiales bacterium]
MSDRMPEPGARARAGAGAGAGADAVPIPYSEIARFPRPGDTAPVHVAFGPGDRVLTYLYSPDGSLERRLFVLDLDGERAGASAEPPHRQVNVGAATVSEEGLSLEEQLRRERTRDVGLGVTSATWADDADVLLVPLPDGLHVVSGLAADPGGARSRFVMGVAEGAPPVLCPRLSPDGTKIAFVQEGDLYVVGTAPGREGEPSRRLTTSATEGITNGIAEFIAQEEMDRSNGCWWSPDSRYLAYTEVDERHIPVYRIVHQGSDDVGPTAQEDHRYPFAGKANAIVRLGVIDLGRHAEAEGDADGEAPGHSATATPAIPAEPAEPATPAEHAEPATPATPAEHATPPITTWMDTGDPDQYLARVHWVSGAVATESSLIAEIEPRDQASLKVVRLDPATGEA